MIFRPDAGFTVDVATRGGYNGPIALSRCRECRREVSTSARTCPYCGCHGPTGRYWLLTVLYAVIIVAAILFTIVILPGLRR